MKHLKYVALAFALAGPSLARADVEVFQSESAQIGIGAWVQVLGFGQHVDDPTADGNRLFLFMKEARLRTSARMDGYRFNLELGLGGEEKVVASTGVSLSLLDLSVDLPLEFLPGSASVRVGQFKVPYGRAQLTYSRDSQFISRSIDNLAFLVGRDVGAALTVHPGPLTATVGVFTGGGRDVPPDHYLPERLGIPLFAARLSHGALDADPYALQDRPQDATWRSAIAVNGLYTKDSTVGHSTVLNVKLADKSLLLDSSWNPYIAKAPFSQGKWWQLGADAALQGGVGRALVSLAAEVDYAGYSNDYGHLNVAGARVQGAVDYQKAEIALRYAILFPDGRFASGGNPVTGTAPIHELTPSLAYYLKGERLKLIADLPVLVQTPVFLEQNVGAYVGTELPGEASLLAKTGRVERQTVVEARLLLQAGF